METGFYRASDPKVSTSDWISLNFSRYSVSIITTLAEHIECLFEGLNRLDIGAEPEFDEDDVELPEEPDPDNDEAYEAWEAACGVLVSDAQDTHDAAYEEWESAQQLMGWPFAWGTCWAARNSSDLVEALAGANFVVYETSGEMEDFGELLFGVDGCGYSFYEAHWIPLRMTLARQQWEKGYCSEEDYTELLDVMGDFITREGGGTKEDFIAKWGAPKTVAA